MTAMIGKQQPVSYAETLQQTLQDRMGTDVEVYVCGAVGVSTKALLENADRPRFLDTVNREVSGLRAMINEHGPFDVVMLLLGQVDLAEGVQAATIVERTLAMHAICFELETPTVILGLPVDHRAATLHSFASRHLLINNILKNWSLGKHESRWSLYVDCAKVMPYTGADYKQPEKENAPPQRKSESRKSEQSRSSTIRKSDAYPSQSSQSEELDGDKDSDDDASEESEEQEEIDVEHIGPDGLGWWQPDGLHLTASGAAVFGKRIAKEVEQFLRVLSVSRSTQK